MPFIFPFNFNGTNPLFHFFFFFKSAWGKDTFSCAILWALKGHGNGSKKNVTCEVT